LPADHFFLSATCVAFALCRYGGRSQRPRIATGKDPVGGVICLPLERIVPRTDPQFGLDRLV
jgi:hypothetical protein